MPGRNPNLSNPMRYIYEQYHGCFRVQMRRLGIQRYFGPETHNTREEALASAQEFRDSLEPAVAVAKATSIRKKKYWHSYIYVDPRTKNEYLKFQVFYLNQQLHPGKHGTKTLSVGNIDKIDRLQILHTSLTAQWLAEQSKQAHIEGKDFFPPHMNDWRTSKYYQNREAFNW